MSGVSNEQILNAVMSLKQDMGGVQAVARNAHEFAFSVSKKADNLRAEMMRADELARVEIAGVAKSISDHKREEGAHGVAAERRGWDGARTAIIAVLGAAVSVSAVLKFFAPLAKAAP